MIRQNLVQFVVDRVSKGFEIQRLSWALDVECRVLDVGQE